MSAADEAVAEMCCASCGTAEVDEIKLKECDACDLVRYCSDNCRKDHRPKHEAICKERMVELRDEILFRQPESTHFGDCPICFLPLPIDHNKSMLQSCCSKIICRGCFYANDLREIEKRLLPRCPFCRHPAPKTQDEFDKNKMKRVEKNDPVALHEAGKTHHQEGNYEGAFEYFTKAAELGNVDAHLLLAAFYRGGKGVEKNEEREIYHLEKAAIAGHPAARNSLACYEWGNGRIDRAVKHFIIAANLGDDESIQALKQCYINGDVSKEDFATALRAHQAAADAMKSPQREAVAKAMAA